VLQERRERRGDYFFQIRKNAFTQEKEGTQNCVEKRKRGLSLAEKKVSFPGERRGSRGRSEERKRTELRQPRKHAIYHNGKGGEK